MAPGTWTIVGAGTARCGIGTGGFTLPRRYVAAAEAVLRTTRSPDGREARH